jgi:hypothetical protein
MLKQKGITLSQLPAEERQDFYYLLSILETYIRMHRRRTFLEAVGKAGLPLTIYGDGWEKHLSKYKSITFKKSLSYEENLSLLQKTHLSINTVDLIYGAQERAFNAMLNGAVAIEPFNNYFKDNDLIDGKDLLLYKWLNLDDCMNKIAILLENPETMWQMAASAKEKAQANHQWINRAQEILKLVETYKNTGRKTG